MANWYLGSTKYTSVAQWAANTVYAANAIVRQLAAPATGSERCFQTTLGGTSHATTEPVWVLTAGATSPTDNTITDWKEITGQAAKNGDGGGAAWAAPHARLGNAIGTNGAGWAAAGDTIYVSNNHAETQASAMTMTSLGTTALPIKVICVSDTVVPPTTVASSATVTTTGTSSMVTNGYALVDGVSINCGTGAGNSSLTLDNTAASSAGWYFYNATLALKGTNIGAVMFIGNAANATVQETSNYFYNCQFVFGATAQKITFRNGLSEMVRCTFAASGSVPAQLCNITSNVAAVVKFRDCDMSTITGTLLGVGSPGTTQYLIEDCELGPGVTMTTSNVTSLGGTKARIHNSDSTATNYRFYEQTYLGVIQQSTSVTRTGGFNNGTTLESAQVITTANTSFYAPYVSPEITIWHNQTGASLSPVLYLTCASTLTNADVWVEWEYMGSASFPIGTSDMSSRAATILTSPTTLTTDATSTWTGGLGNNYKITATFTPNMVGPIKARLYVAKASLTLNFDLKWDMIDSLGNIKSSGRQYLIPGCEFIVETAPSFTNSNMIGGMGV